MEIIPFPSIRRVGIRRRAATLLSYSERGAERTLAAQLKAQRMAMLRKGIAPDAVEKDLRALEMAIRAEMWRMERSGDAA